MKKRRRYPRTKPLSAYLGQWRWRKKSRKKRRGRRYKGYREGFFMAVFDMAHAVRNPERTYVFRNIRLGQPFSPPPHEQEAPRPQSEGTTL